MCTCKTRQTSSFITNLEEVTKLILISSSTVEMSVDVFQYLRIEYTW